MKEKHRFMKHKLLSAKLWIFLLSSIICFGIGCTLLVQYGMELSNINEILDDEFEKSSWDMVYHYTNNEGQSKHITAIDFKYDDDFNNYIMNDIYGKEWVSSHKALGKELVFAGIILFIIFTVQLLKHKEGTEFIGIIKIPSIGVVVGCIICWLGIAMMYTPESEVERSIHHGSGNPIWSGFVFLIIGFGIIGFALYIGSRAISRYKLAKYQPEVYKQMIEEEKAQVERNAAIHRAMLDAERDAAVNGTQGAPWEKQYLPYPCPYCRRYKVRYIKWEDKRASIYFWGRLSTKIGTHYICDNCKKTWE